MLIAGGLLPYFLQEISAFEGIEKGAHREKEREKR